MGWGILGMPYVDQGPDMPDLGLIGRFCWVQYYGRFLLFWWFE
jgi:hypothetical protein